MYETILVPADGSDGALAAAREALDLLAPHGTVHVLYVLDTRMSPLSAEIDREEALGLLADSDHDPTGPVLDLAETAGVEAVETIRLGVPHEVICEFVSEQAVDLVVMGTHGRTGIEHALLGSVTERVVRLAEAPVLTVHPDAE
jgi:nucleotide-binding universal stress UspA family protein